MAEIREECTRYHRREKSLAETFKHLSDQHVLN
jgi:hypothetical protein